MKLVVNHPSSARAEQSFILMPPDPLSTSCQAGWVAAGSLDEKQLAIGLVLGAQNGLICPISSVGLGLVEAPVGCLDEVFRLEGVKVTANHRGSDRKRDILLAEFRGYGEGSNTLLKACDRHFDIGRPAIAADGRKLVAAELGGDDPQIHEQPVFSGRSVLSSRRSTSASSARIVYFLKQCVVRKFTPHAERAEKMNYEHPLRSSPI